MTVIGKIREIQILTGEVTESLADIQFYTSKLKNAQMTFVNNYQKLSFYKYTYQMYKQKSKQVKWGKEYSENFLADLNIKNIDIDSEIVELTSKLECLGNDWKVRSIAQ